MRKIKKIFSLVLVAALALGLFAACGKKDDDKTVVRMEIITYGMPIADLMAVQDEINKIAEAEIGVTVELIEQPIGTMIQDLGNKISVGDDIDIVCTGLLRNPTMLHATGQIIPMTEYLKKSDKLMQLADGLLGACTIDGEIYAYPGSLTPGTQNTFFYDVDLASQYNIQLPERINGAEDWENIFNQVIASGMEQKAITLGDGVAAEYQWADYDALGDYSAIAYGAVMAGDEDTNKIVNYYGTPEYVAKCKMHREWMEKGYVLENSSENNLSTQDCMRAGTIFGFTSAGGTGMSAAYWSSVTGRNIAGVPMGDVSISADNVINLSWGLSANCENPEKCVEFLELIFTNTEVANLLNYGIEGKHYVTTPGTKIINYPEGIDPSNCGWGMFVGTYGDNSQTYQRPPFTDEDIANFSQFGYPKAECSKYLAYVFDASSVETEVANVSAVVSQYAPSLACGKVENVDAQIKEFNEKLKEAGIDKIIEENQKQLDAWIAAQ